MTSYDKLKQNIHPIVKIKNNVTMIIYPISSRLNNKFHLIFHLLSYLDDQNLLLLYFSCDGLYFLLSLGK